MQHAPLRGVVLPQPEPVRGHEPGHGRPHRAPCVRARRSAAVKRALLAFAFLALIVPALHAQSPQFCSSPYYVEQAFPTSGAEVSRWRLCWQFVDGPGLAITGLWFRPTPASQWIKVMWDGRLAELFVPYHPGGP